MKALPCAGQAHGWESAKRGYQLAVFLPEDVLLGVRE
jgi:hypothetical protein